jgi:hypothetical protein
MVSIDEMADVGFWMCIGRDSFLYPSTLVPVPTAAAGL